MRQRHFAKDGAQQGGLARAVGACNGGHAAGTETAGHVLPYCLSPHHGPRIFQPDRAGGRPDGHGMEMAHAISPHNTPHGTVMQARRCHHARAIHVMGSGAGDVAGMGCCMAVRLSWSVDGEATG